MQREKRGTPGPELFPTGLPSLGRTHVALPVRGEVEERSQRPTRSGLPGALPPVALPGASDAPPTPEASISPYPGLGLPLPVLRLEPPIRLSPPTWLASAWVPPSAPSSHTYLQASSPPPHSRLPPPGFPLGWHPPPTPPPGVPILPPCGVGRGGCSVLDPEAAERAAAPGSTTTIISKCK